MDKIIVKGKLIRANQPLTGWGVEVPMEGTEATIELSPRELLEQIPHAQIAELLEMINLPQPQQEHSKQNKDGNPIWEKPQQDKCPKEAKSEKTFELEEILHRLLSRYKEGIISYTIKGESHWDKELEISCTVKEIKRWAEQSEKGELASKEEIEKIISEVTFVTYAFEEDRKTNLKKLMDEPIRAIAHALVGKVEIIKHINRKD